MIDCKKAVDLLVDFLEDNVSPEVRRDLIQHLDGCPPCLEFIETYKKTAVLCKETLRREAPREFGERLLTFLRRETGRFGNKIS